MIQTFTAQDSITAIRTRVRKSASKAETGVMGGRILRERDESAAGLARLVQASTTTDRFVAQEMMKPNSLVRTPKLGPSFRITGFASDHSAVGRPPNGECQPVVPGK